MIDIIIPIYNARSTLRNTLMSVYTQTVVDQIRVYLVDDCSIENYDDILDEYKDKINLKYKKLESNVGSGLARNYALKNTDSDYVIFLDADDCFYATDSVEKLYKTISEGFDYVSGFSVIEKDNTYCDNISDLHGKIYRREFLFNNKISFNETRFHEDNAFNNLVLICNPRKKSINEMVYVYCYNENSITAVDEMLEFKRLEILFYNMRYVLNEAIKRNCDENLIKYFMYMKVRFLIRRWEEFKEEQKNVVLKWLKEYNLDVDKYFIYDDFKLLENIFYKEYVVV